MKQLLYICILVLLSLSSYAQEFIKGKVTDAQSEEALAFVNILFNESNTGVSTDIDGTYKLPNTNIKTLTFSYIGYKKLSLSIEELKQRNYQVTLTKSSYNLEEVVVLPGVNPAHRIINLAIANRDLNNPEKATDFFYESYNKMVFTTPIDTSRETKLDSITVQSAIEEKTDSFNLSKVLFLMESVSERNYFPPDFSKEVVKESRISGLKTPFFSLLGTQLQSFSLYKNQITLYGINYLSPISKGSTSKYLFIIEDTLFSGKDTSFIISFRPRRNKYFTALKGVLSINTNNYAVETFIAQQADSNAFPIRVQQKYKLIDNKQWFPVQLHMDILFQPTMEEDGFTLIGVGKSYLRKIELNSKIAKKEIGNISVKMDPNIRAKDEAYWKTIREVPLSRKEEASYHIIDSIGEAENLDRMVYFTKGFVKGTVPIWKLDLLLNRIVRFNGFEGTRLGLGLETSERLTRSFRIGGYAGYGFKDKAWKYGSHIRWVPKSERQFEVKLMYENDVTAIGGVNFFQKTRDLTSTSNIQNFLNPEFDGLEKYQGEISFRALRDFHFSLFGNQQQRSFNSTYAFNDENGNSINPSRFHLTEAGANFRFSFREKFAEFLGVTVPIVTKYPIVYFKYTRGFADLLEGEFDYNRLDLSVFKSSVIKNLGTTSFQLNAGMIDAVIPLTGLYAMRGIFDDDFKVASSYSFETMLPNEFFADKYVNLFFRHNFGKLLFQSAKFKPELLLVSSVAYGSLQSAERHENFDFKTLDKGFFESGIQLNNLLRWEYFYKGVFFGFGAGTYYRYGAYAHDDFEDNISFKITTSFSM